jgi:restriction system protein
VAKRKNIIKDIIRAVSRQPWWVGILLAAVSYLLLHAFAIYEATPDSIRGSAGNIGGLLRGISSILQYIVPAIFILGSLGSIVKRGNQDKLYAQASTNTPLEVIDTMSWHDFEQLTAAVFRKEGFDVQDTNDGPDGGVDLVLKKGGETYLVQCKHWRTYKVGVKVIRELYGVIASTGAAGGFVVTAGVYTHEARVFAENIQIDLIDGVTLEQWLKQPEQVEFTVSNEDSILAHRLEKKNKSKFLRGYSKVAAVAASFLIIIGAFYGLHQITSKQLENVLTPATSVSSKQKFSERNPAQNHGEKTNVTEPRRNEMISLPGVDGVVNDEMETEKLSFVAWYKVPEECLASKSNPNPDITECANRRIRARREYVKFLQAR